MDRLTISIDNFARALAALHRAVALPPEEERDYAGIIKSFEFVYELAWKTLKRFLEREGHEADTARSIFKLSYQLGLLDDEALWLEIIDDRNKTVHTYNERFAIDLVGRIASKYVPAFDTLHVLLKAKLSHTAD